MINGKRPEYYGNEWQDELDNVPEHIREEAFRLTRTLRRPISVGKLIIYGTKGFSSKGFEKMFYDPKRYAFKNSNWEAKVEYPVPTNDLLP